ncbi:hypothetical protein D3C86_1676440 [compost metagenome]
MSPLTVAFVKLKVPSMVVSRMVRDSSVAGRMSKPPSKREFSISTADPPPSLLTLQSTLSKSQSRIKCLVSPVTFVHLALHLMNATSP